MDQDEVKRGVSRPLLIIVILVFALLFTGLGISLSRGPITAWDVDLSAALHGLNIPFVTHLMLFVTWTGEPIAAALTILLVLVFWLRSQRRRAILFAVCVGGAALANEGLKRLFTRTRPDLFPPLAREIGFSFPSGHTTTAAALYGLSAILLYRSGHRASAVILVLWVLLVGTSRIYLAVHWPSDVLGSLLFSASWLLAVFTLDDFSLRRREASPQKER